MLPSRDRNQWPRLAEAKFKLTHQHAPAGFAAPGNSASIVGL